eukprot:764313-Hanusia_phi.AAC.3
MFQPQANLEDFHVVDHLHELLLVLLILQLEVVKAFLIAAARQSGLRASPLSSRPGSLQSSPSAVPQPERRRSHPAPSSQLPAPPPSPQCPVQDS